MKLSAGDVIAQDLIRELAVVPEGIGAEHKMDDETHIITFDVSNGAVQICWTDQMLTEAWGRSSGDLVFEVAFRAWDRTHGLSEEHIEANCYSPHSAAAVALALAKMLNEADQAMEDAMGMEDCSE